MSDTVKLVPPLEKVRLRKLRGNGPVFHRFGRRIRYSHTDLAAWAATRRRASTYDDGTVLAGAKGNADAG